MEALLPRALERFVGSTVGSVTNKDQLAGLAEFGPPAVFVLSPSRALMNMLRDKGYTHLHSFVAIPSHGMPRWLLPARDSCGMVAGTQIYQPHKLTPRVIKTLLIGMMKMGWDGWWRTRVLVASKARLPLEALVRSVTGEAQPAFALSLGRQAAVRKLTVQVMRPSGEILGYLKLPLTDAAAERVRNEAKILDRLWTFPALRPHIPRVLYAGKWNDTYVLFRSALEGERGPLAFNGMHEKFLQTLWDVHCMETPGQTVIAAVAAKWDNVVGRLGTEWEELGNEVFRRSTRDLEGKMLRCGVMHGDFAPWNTRLRQQELLVFDWESAVWEAPISWDIFYFQVQTSFFFRTNKTFQIPKRQPFDDISFMLFILSSVCQRLEEEDFSAINDHKEFLLNALH